MEAKHFRSASGEVARDIVECKSFGIMTESPQEVFSSVSFVWIGNLCWFWFGGETSVFLAGLKVFCRSRLNPPQRCAGD